jgi:hypothetical protein
MATTSAGPSADEFRALTSALDHARAMVIATADLRTKNFNFYLVITGVLVAGYAKPSNAHWPLVFAIAGIVSSILFFGLDVRGSSFNRHSADQMAILEPLVWERACIRELWTPIPHDGGLRIISHKWISRMFFAVTTTAWIIALVLSLYFRPEETQCFPAC